MSISDAVQRVVSALRENQHNTWRRDRDSEVIRGFLDLLRKFREVYPNDPGRARDWITDCMGRDLTVEVEYLEHNWPNATQ